MWVERDDDDFFLTCVRWNYYARIFIWKTHKKTQNTIKERKIKERQKNEEIKSIKTWKMLNAKDFFCIILCKMWRCIKRKVNLFWNFLPRRTQNEIIRQTPVKMLALFKEMQQLELIFLPSPSDPIFKCIKPFMFPMAYLRQKKIMC